MVTAYGARAAIRSSQTSLGSPMDTQTSVATKSAPRTPSATSSVSVMRAPLVSASLRAAADDRPRPASSALGATIRTSMPSRAPVTR